MTCQRCEGQSAVYQRHCCGVGAGDTSSTWTHNEHMQHGAEQGWWDRWDDVGPLKTVRVAAGQQWDKVAVDNGIFTSFNQARKNGWFGPVADGRLAKGRRILFLVELADHIAC